MTRDEAKAAGLKHYMPTEPCKREHFGRRLVSTGQCCQCLLERSQTPAIKAQREAYYKTNREEIAAKNATHYKANRENISAQGAAYYKANRENISAQGAAYYKANREKIAARQSAYNKANAESTAAYRAAYYRANREKTAAKNAEYYNAHRTEREAYYKANPHIRKALNAKRRAQKIQATPRWADFEAIKEIYRQCAEQTKTTGIPHAVDHIIPLQGKKVCGLHVAANLQILTATDNLKKSNKLLPMYETP